MMAAKVAKQKLHDFLTGYEELVQRTGIYVAGKDLHGPFLDITHRPWDFNLGEHLHDLRNSVQVDDSQLALFEEAS